MRDHDPVAGVDEPRTALGLIGDRTFGPYLASKMLASIGVWVYNVVAAIVVFDLTASAFMVGVVSVVMFLPQLLLAPLAGARADQGSPRLQLAVGRLAAVGGAGGLATYAVIAGLDGMTGAWLVIATGLVVGVGFAVSGPAMHAVLPALVRPAELGTAVALSQTPFTVARAIGPAIGAGILAVTGPPAAFAFAAVSNLVFALMALRLRLRPVERIVDADRSVRAGLRHLRTDPVCAVLLAGVTAVGFGVDPVITLSPSIADGLGGGERLVGAMASAFGAGAAITALTAGTVRRRVDLTVLGPAGLLGFAVGYLALAAAPTALLAVASLVVAGSGMIFAITSFTTQLQARLPEHLRGRVMALWMVAFIGSRPLAAAINGSVADAVAAEAALLIGVAVLVAGAVATRPRATAAPPPVVTAS